MTENVFKGGRQPLTVFMCLLQVQGLKEKLAQTEERLEEREKELLAIIDKLGDEVKSVRFEMGSRGGR